MVDVETKTRVMRTAAFMLSWLLAVASAFAATPQLCSGRYHSLTLRSDGRVLASGSDAYGQLGQGRLLLRSTPARVTNLSGIRAVSSRNGGTVLALGSDGHVYAWGDNEYGELGVGTLQYYGNGFVVSNIGTLRHELVVIRTDRAADGTSRSLAANCASLRAQRTLSS